jgi:hypothetical protein
LGVKFLLDRLRIWMISEISAFVSLWEQKKAEYFEARPDFEQTSPKPGRVRR